MGKIYVLGVLVLGDFDVLMVVEGERFRLGVILGRNMVGQ